MFVVSSVLLTKPVIFVSFCCFLTQVKYYRTWDLDSQTAQLSDMTPNVRGSTPHRVYFDQWETGDGSEPVDTFTLHSTRLRWTIQEQGASEHPDRRPLVAGGPPVCCCETGLLSNAPPYVGFLPSLSRSLFCHSHCPEVGWPRQH